VACVEYLKKEGLASKAAIFGGSSGGYTTLAALVSRSEVFDAGCSLYGIAELTGLALDTHKFESGYLFGLIGGTPEEIPDVYRERSPLTHAANIKAPLLVLQGQDDKVVPIEQADAIVKAVKANGGEVEYHVFPGEGHGFRRLENQLTSLTSRVSP
jgi:dipeptidyl aminopeptidase/acylaminoacyl peptidase